MLPDCKAGFSAGGTNTIMLLIREDWSRGIYRKAVKGDEMTHTADAKVVIMINSASSDMAVDVVSP